MEEALYACRFVQFTLAIIIFGAVSFRYYAIAGNDEPAASSVATLDAWVAQVALAAAIAALASALALLLCETAAMAVSPAAVIDPGALSAVLFETRFGRVWSCHVLMALLVMLGCLVRSRARSAALLIPSLLCSRASPGSATPRSPGSPMSSIKLCTCSPPDYGSAGWCR